ncbi:MAG: SDR family oxidoreductase [Oscillospiraceae bacterium]|nr:SDR family oxidoreductase [Oscillospiraceae bacterium]
MPKINRCGLEYQGKVVLVTGGSKGIGEGCARVFADALSDVVIAARGVEAGERLAEEINALGRGSCMFIRCDVSRPDQITRLIDEVIERFGRLDCLINNAGYHPEHRTIDDFSLDDFMDVMQTNFVSCFIACKHALPHIRKVKGSIINMGSLVGQMGQEAATIYCATKGAIAAFTKSLAIEEARHGVRVNCVSPGNILTNSRIEGSRAADDPAAMDSLVDSWQPTGRSGINEDVGQLCLFLASDAAGYITGADHIISGGSELGYGVKYPLMFIRD